MIFAIDIADNTIVLDSRMDGAERVGNCVYCGRPVELLTTSHDTKLYLHSLERDAVACLKARSRFPR